MLTAGLRDADAVVRADAARLLGELGRREAAKPLCAYVASDRYYSKAAGMHALAQIGDASAIAALQPLVDEPNVPDDWYWFGHRSVRTAAAVALLQLGDDTGTSFLTNLADKNDDLFACWYGPTILKLSGAPPQSGTLKSRLTVALIRDGKGTYATRFTEPGVTLMAARTLGILGGDEACAVLLDLMQHQSRYVRAEAAVSLLAASAAEPHKAAARRLAEKDHTDFERIKVTRGLVASGIGDSAVIADLARTAADAVDRATALEALGLVGDPQHGDLLIESLKHDDPYGRQCAVEALDRLAARGDASRYAQAVEPLLGDDPSPRVRHQVAKFLVARSEALS